MAASDAHRVVGPKGISTMATPFAIVVSALIIAATAAVMLRYEMVVQATPAPLIRVDRWTGDIDRCYWRTNTARIDCSKE